MIQYILNFIVIIILKISIKKAPQVEVLTGFVFANIVWCLNNELTLMIF
jgi:hypothetical protein